MRAHEVDLISMVQATKQFQVPLYQRPCSWLEPQLKQLWGDLLAEADRLKDEEGGSGHFLGSVVLAPSPVALGPSGLQRWLVVDGQQRLTTLMIALAAIRDHVAEEEPQLAQRIDVEYLINQFETGDARLRLLPTQADRDAFRACVLRLPGADTADGVGAAYRFFQAELGVADDSDDPHDVARIEQVIRRRLRLVEIVAEPGDNVHRIFQSLNNTGLQLSQADLFRINQIRAFHHGSGVQVAGRHRPPEPNAPGTYGDVVLDAAQLANAQRIVDVGRLHGASYRDRIIAVATAMQESKRYNFHHGDRNSLGLFQQRAGGGEARRRGPIRKWLPDPSYTIYSAYQIEDRDR